MGDGEQPGLASSGGREGASRRTVLKGTAGAGLGLAGLGVPAWSGAAVAALATPTGLDGRRAFRTAQHVHASGSEGTASMTAQAAEAVQHVHALWITDHDWREAAVGAPRVIHFNSLTSEALPPNPAWTWTRVTSGSLDPAGTGGGIGTDTSPADPDPTGSLLARARSNGQAPASLSWFGDDARSRNSMRTRVQGQTWTIEVKLRQAPAGAWGFLRLALSYHPATSGRPDAYYFLEYRFGRFAERSHRIESADPSLLGSGEESGDPVVLQAGEAALVGVVEVPQAPGGWRTQTLDLAADVQAAFPGMIAGDNAVRAVWLGATSTRAAPADVAFDYLRMERVRGNDQLVARRSLASRLASTYPGLAVHHGTEVSYRGDHHQWLGGDVRLPSYPSDKASGGAAPSAAETVAMINDAGGLAVVSHPFGSSGAAMTTAEARAEARSIARALADSGVDGGAEGIETFYRSRAGATLEDHWFLARLLVRLGCPLTLFGASDNHWGADGSWALETNRFVTGVYSESVGEADLVAALRRGRAFAAEIGSFGGALDLSFDDGSVVMGQIDVGSTTRTTRQLNVLATSLPAAAVVEVYRVPVDLATDGEPGAVVATLGARDFTGGRARVTVGTAQDFAFAVLLGVRTSSGAVRRVAGSNPIWHLRKEPTWTVPEVRRA